MQSVDGISICLIGVLIAMYALLSALSFPFIPIWLGIQQNVIVCPVSLASVMILSMSPTMGSRVFFNAIDSSALRESLYIIVFFMSSSIAFLTAVCMAKSSAVKMEA